MTIKMFITLALSVLILIAALLILSITSRTVPALGLVNGKLHPCPNKPNCLCSEYQGEHYIGPLTVNPDDDISKYIAVVKSMHGELLSSNDEYLRARFTTAIMRFVDDFELRLDRANMQLHFRSASRVGYSDLGKNRKRIEEFKTRLQSIKNDVGNGP